LKINDMLLLAAFITAWNLWYRLVNVMAWCISEAWYCVIVWLVGLWKYKQWSWIILEKWLNFIFRIKW